MLQIGNGLLTDDEEQTHFTMWALAKAPLILGCDLDTLTQTQLDLVTNKELIGINQDSLGHQVKCVQGCGQANTYAVYQGLTNYGGPHMAVFVVNFADDFFSETVAFDLV